MNRRTFLLQSSGLAIAVYAGPSLLSFGPDKMDRLGMGTVVFRNRFKQTKPKELETISNELTLLTVPSYYREKFNIRKLEFWSKHFESLEQPYLIQLRDKIKKAKSKLINVQIDEEYDLASTNEEERQRSLQLVKKWIDGVALLGSECIRINPGKTNGSVDKSIESMKEVLTYTKNKKLVLLTENHFGIEMNTDIHIKIIKEAGPGIYSLPDFGNYPVATMWESLAKMMPYAYLISAKTITFNSNMEHITYDFDKCVQLAEKAGFKGVYSVEQWAPGYQDMDYEKIAQWMIDHVKNNI